MDPQHLETLLLENIDKPHRLVLASGDEVIVPTFRAAYIDGHSLSIVHFRSPDRMTGRRQLISIPNIVLAEVIDRSKPPPPPPRRKRGK